MNHLQHETSPYLLQHASNPVDWYAWKPEAFERAEKEDKPILVSIGYSTCHWCHVMERESFENESVAAFMNEHFINIKVDREERPDVDQIYMEACQYITGGGGWPLNVFLTPDKKPFLAGTYYPPEQAYNRPAWIQVLQYVVQMFREKRETVEAQAKRLTEMIQRSDKSMMKEVEAPVGTNPFNRVMTQQIFERIKDTFDHEYGGWGSAPKFPATMTMQYLVDYYVFSGDQEALDQVTFTLDKMIRGGIYDQLGGGFARYAVDKAWLVPHFEKMLYDNALLIRLLARVFKLTGKQLYKETIEETLGFVEREMTTEEGGFYSALDADSEGEEGKFYVWTKEEVDAILGEEASLFNAFYGVMPGGNWEGNTILWRPLPLEGFAAQQELEVGPLKEQLRLQRAKLLEARSERIRPGLDDKVLLSWNSMQAIAYAEAYEALGIESYKETAVRNVEFIRDRFTKDESLALYHTYKEGTAQYEAFLDDYANWIDALLAVYQITFDTNYLMLAKRYTDHVIAEFLDADSKMFYFTTANQKDLPIRRKDLYDSSVPSGNSTMVSNLLRLSLLLAHADYHKLASEMLLRVKESVEKYPRSFGRWANQLLYLTYPAREIAVVGSNYERLATEINHEYWPNSVIMGAVEANPNYPLLEGRGNGNDTLIYLCENYACRQPVKTLEEFRQLAAEVES
jgi:uncharacterized protein YyaL (SSP411 family)